MLGFLPILIKDELISDVLLWSPTHGRAKAGRAARTYIQQVCEDTGCSPEDLPEAMNDRERWRERVRGNRATARHDDDDDDDLLLKNRIYSTGILRNTIKNCH